MPITINMEYTWKTLSLKTTSNWKMKLLINNATTMLTVNNYDTAYHTEKKRGEEDHKLYTVET